MTRGAKWIEPNLTFSRGGIALSFPQVILEGQSIRVTEYIYYLNNKKDKKNIKSLLTHLTLNFTGNKYLGSRRLSVKQLKNPQKPPKKQAKIFPYHEI